MFSTGNFSLKRLDEMCAVLELDIGDLVNISESQLPKIEQLSAEHEREIVSDIRLLLVTYCLINYWTFEEILERYDISMADGLRYLRRLDRMNIMNCNRGTGFACSSPTISREKKWCNRTILYERRPDRVFQTQLQG